MPAITTAEQFQEVLELARRLSQTREAVSEFEGTRVGAHPNLVRSWLGPARDVFEQGWDATTTTRSSADEQMLAWEGELARMFADAAERHNEESYERALREASGVLEGERAEHNALVEAASDLDAMTFGIFTDQPRDRVRWASPAVSVPVGPYYNAGAAFMHYDRYGNEWHPVWREYPDSAVLGSM